MTNREIADALDELGTILELLGENPFKCRAFHNAARVIGGSTADLRKAAEEGTLTGIPGIGKGLAPIVADLAIKGKSAEAGKLRRSVPAGLLEMLRIQGLGPKKVKLLHDRLRIDSIEKLRDAARSGRLAPLEGFGKKSEENILRGLDILEKHSGKRLFPDAEAAAEAMLSHVSGIPGVKVCAIAGSLRRKKEVIGDIDILAAAPRTKAAGIIRSFAAHPDVTSELSSGPTKGSVLLRSGIQCDLRVVDIGEYPFALQYFTGSKEHNVELRALAGTRGWTMNEYGFSPAEGKGGPPGEAAADAAGGKASSARRPPKTATAAPGPSKRSPRSAPVCRNEEEIYRALGLAPIPPELREADGEIVAAGKDRLPDLLSISDIRGTFHCHTTYSDGRNTLEEMVDAAVRLRWEYIGIADHSKVAVYANGLKEKDVLRQLEEIRGLNEGLKGFRIFSGTEVDILPDGSLDWSDRVLAGFDYVVASIHSRFSMTEQEATRRVIGALKNPHVTMLGHPTGRLLLEREGYPVNMREVIDAAADYGKMIEINANPHRLDLDWRYCRYAREKGIIIVINPDAHTAAGLGDVRFGVNVARKGWLRRQDVLNARPLEEVSRIIGRKAWKR